MRKISIQDDLRVGFPGQSTAFHDGVEIGVLALSMASGPIEFCRTVSDRNIEQARSLARGLGYHLISVEGCGDGSSRLTFRDRRHRAKLRLVRGAAS